MRTRQTARKSTSARDTRPENRARMIAAQERYLDGLARVNDLNGINDAIQNGDLGQFNENGLRMVHPIIRAERLEASREHRVTTGPNGRVYERPRPRQTARKAGLSHAEFLALGGRPMFPLSESPSSSTEVQSKQVHKRPEDEVSLGGTRRPRISSSQSQPMPSSSTHTQPEEIVISSSDSE